MKIIYNNILPFKGFKAMLTLSILWVRKEYRGSRQLDQQFFNHEKIHSCQQLEIWIASLVVMSVLCLIAPLSWWWLLITPAIPLLVYGICWMIEICLPPFNRAYGNICFEAEAQYNESNPDYLKERCLFTFRFLKYISNKKYPYIERKNR